MAFPATLETWPSFGSAKGHMKAVLCEMHRKVLVHTELWTWVRVFQTRKSLRRDSKEIIKPAIFAQPIALLEFAPSKISRTILRNAYKNRDENDYGLGWHCGID